MSEPLPARTSRRFALAVAASLVIHGLVAAPFLFQVPERPAAASQESVPVELVPPPPPPQRPPPEEKQADTPKAARTKRPAAAPPKPGAEAPASSGAPPPFESSAREAPEEPPQETPPSPPEDNPSQAASQPAAAAEKSSAPAAATPTEPQPPAPPSAEAKATSKTVAEGSVDEQQISATAATPPLLSTKGGHAVSNDAPPPPAAGDPAKAEGDPTMSPAEVAAFVPARPPRPQAKPHATPAKEQATAPELRKAQTLFAKEILADPRVRGALSKLPPSRRMSQICSIELLEQVRHSGFTPDLLVPSSNRGRRQGATQLTASGGAVRSRGVWRNVAFECSVDAEVTAVTEFRFALGAIVPRSEWAARNLNVD